MHRNLITYKHVKGAEGNELVPDLAEEVPEPTNNGLTYTFNLKDGIKWAPPVDREIVCDDFAYALGRIDVEEEVAQYGSYYDGTIEGMDGPKPYKGEVTPPSGVKCLDEKTLEITLQQATGDFLYRMAMGAAAPQPPEVSECFNGGKAGDYGAFQVSSGPYMFEGLDEMDIRSCDTIKQTAPSGFSLNEHIFAGAQPELRPRDGQSGGQRATTRTGSSSPSTRTRRTSSTRSSVERSRTPPSSHCRRYSRSTRPMPELKKRLLVAGGDRTWYMTMNLTQPPFDDIHVRKAANYILDKAAIQRVWGGELAGEIATHILPPEITGGHPTSEEYDPYAERRVPGQPGGGQGRDESVEVRHRPRRHL